MKTLNQHISLFRTFANNHLQVNSFGVGDPWEFNSSGVIYPSMCVVIEDSQVSGGTLTDNYQIIFSDRVRHDEVDEQFSLSQMKQIALDLLAYLENGGVLSVSEILSDGATLSDFTERFDDVVSGWVLTFSIEQANIYDYCNIPLNS